eukprot:gene11124-biopygen18369
MAAAPFIARPWYVKSSASPKRAIFSLGRNPSWKTCMAAHPGSPRGTSVAPPPPRTVLFLGVRAGEAEDFAFGAGGPAAPQDLHWTQRCGGPDGARWPCWIPLRWGQDLPGWAAMHVFQLGFLPREKMARFGEAEDFTYQGRAINGPGCRQGYLASLETWVAAVRNPQPSENLARFLPAGNHLENGTWSHPHEAQYQTRRDPLSASRGQSAPRSRAAGGRGGDSTVRGGGGAARAPPPLAENRKGANLHGPSVRGRLFEYLRL